MSGIAEHAQLCKKGFKFKEASTISIEENFQQRKIREAVEIRTRRRMAAQVINRDSGSYLKTTQWDVLLSRIDLFDK